MAEPQDFPCVGCGQPVSPMALKCPHCERLFPAGSVITRRPGAPAPPPPPPPAGVAPPPEPPDPRGPADGTEQADPLIGALLNGQYRVRRRIGVGGMGAVYLAEEEGMRREVAVKVMMPRPGDPADRQKRFQREAQAASKLAHPNIVTVHNFGRLKDGTLFLAMEHIDGKHLGDVLKHERPLAVQRTLSLAAQVADAVAEAHEAGIIHRDLKPDNIMLGKRRGQEVAKILDFGIAKLTDPGEDTGHTTRAGLVRGTPRYMSPEQARGDQVDQRSDVYSLGVILYFALSGNLPIQADTPFGYLHAHQHQIPPPLRKARPDLGLSPSLEALVMRCLAKDPTDRPSNMHEVLAALRLEHAHITGATPDPAWESVAPLPRRSYAFPAAASAAAVVLIGAAAWWFWPTDGPRGSSGVRDAEAGAVDGAAMAPLPMRVVEASGAKRPDWALADLSLVPAEPAEGDPKGVVVVGRSGPAADLAEGRTRAEADAAERLLERLLERFPEADLRLTLQGWIGDRRMQLEGKTTYAFKRLLASGPDDSMAEVFTQWQEGQDLVITGIESASGERTAGLKFGTAYWERYRFGRPDRPEEFHLVWVRALLPEEQSERTVRRFSSGVKLAGVTAVEPFPLIAWRGGDVRGAMVHRVADGSPAAKAKLGPGDLIQSVGEQRVRRLSDLEPALSARLAESKKTGDPIPLSIRRPGEGELTVELRFPKPKVPPKPKGPRKPTEIDE